MKNYSHTDRLKARKLQLKVKQLEQEKNIRKQWIDLKGEVSTQAFQKIKDSKNSMVSPEKKKLLSDALLFGAGIVSRKLKDIAGKKIDTAIQKGVEKFARRMK